MRNDLTELVFILDRSGSMHGMESDTIGGFNSMIEKQKKLSGRAYVSTVLFDHETTLLHDRVELHKVSPMTERDYIPRGCTALLDALGGAIHHMGKVHRYARKDDIPEHTVFVIITDGKENASRHYTADRVRQMVEKEKRKYGWEFLFLGANMDAIYTANHFGIEENRAVTYRGDRDGTKLNYDAIHDAVTGVRCCAEIPQTWKTRIEEDVQRRK